MSPSPVALSAGARTVTTTDVLKTAALVFVLVDHVGFYFVEDETWWRVFGRLAAPVFFFLIGFARSRSVPWTWLAFGGLITLLDVVGSDEPFDARLNILLNFALLRLALPVVEKLAVRGAGGLLAVTLVCIVLAPVAGAVLEYGTEGWLWALVGLLHRRTAEAGEAEAGWWRQAALSVALSACVVYVLVESAAQGFDRLESGVLAALVAGLAVILVTFRRADLRHPPPEPLASLLRFGGRWSLEIYAAHLVVLEVWSLVA